MIQVTVKHVANATGKLVGREGVEPSTKRLRGSSAKNKRGRSRVQRLKE